MHILRGILVFGLLIGAFFVSGPVLGIMLFGSTLMLPVLFVVALAGLAVWKIRDLCRPADRSGSGPPAPDRDHPSGRSARQGTS